MADQVDKFGIKMIYPTRTGAREWFLKDSPDEIMGDSRVYGDLEDEVEDGGNQTDGFTIADEGQVRLSVAPVSGIAGEGDPDLDQSVAKGRGWNWSTKDWDIHGIEMTARIKCTDTDGQTDGVIFTMKGPTGDHSGSPNCSGSSYSSRFYLDPSGADAGIVQYTKEQWHVHYVSKPKKASGLGQLFNQWIGVKYIIYTVKASNGIDNWVKLEQWINKNNDGVSWQMVNSIVDSGGWGDDATECNADRDDEIMVWDGPIMIYRWDGPHIIFRNLSIREINPSGVGDIGAPPPAPTTGTVSRDWILKNNIIAFPIDACNIGQDISTFNVFYNVASSGSASNLHKERYRVGIVANGSNSFVIGKKPKRVRVILSKTGTPPEADITVVMRKGSDDEVAVTYTYTGGGTLTPADLTTSGVQYTFENLTSNYAWQNGDRLLVEYSGNTADVANEVNVYRDTANPVDGAFTCAIKFDVGGIPPTAYSAPDITRDYAWEISE